MAAGGNQQPATNESIAPAPTTLPNDEYPDGEASAAAQLEDPWSNIIGSWIHDTAVSAAMSWSQDKPWDAGYGTSVPYHSYPEVANEATPLDSGHDSFGCVLESGGKDCEMSDSSHYSFGCVLESDRKTARCLRFS